MEKLIGRTIEKVSLQQGFIELDEGTRLYLDEDEIKIFEDEADLDYIKNHMIHKSRS